MKQKRKFILPLLLAASPLMAQNAQQPTMPQAELPSPETDPAVIESDSSYGFGYNSGMAFKQQMSRFGLGSEDLDLERFSKGLLDAIKGEDSAVSKEKIDAAMLGLRNQIQEREKVVAAENLQEAEEFLAENKEREEVQTTDSGLQYEVLEEGEGESYDGSENARFLVNYQGTLIDGTELDASPEGSPVPMTLNQQTPAGMKEALQTMPVGAKWKLFLKPELAYGEQRINGDVGPNSALIYEVELTDIQKPAPRPKAVSPAVEIPAAPQKEESDSE
jgi:FKBP-type peptidyl-prolyl cis-trans isomerase